MYITDRDAEFTDTINNLYAGELHRAPDPGGFANWLDELRRGMTGEQMRQALHDSPEGIAARAKPPVHEAPELIGGGRDFVGRDGARYVLNGCDQFQAFRMFLDGKDLMPLFAEAREVGEEAGAPVNLWRVFFAGAKSQNQYMDLVPGEPGFYESVTAFADFVNDQGIALLAEVNIDSQIIMPDRRLRVAHWGMMADLLRGKPGRILSGGNEWSKNGFDPGELNDPGMLWSRGSDVGDVMPYGYRGGQAPAGPVLLFHPRRDLPAALMDTVASAVYIYQGLGNRKLIIDEPPRMGPDGSAPEYAAPNVCYGFARHYATECAGAVYHSRAGQQGRRMNSAERVCFVAWSKGMRL